MNDGKICVSVCAETADELIEQIKRAESLADVIEIRFDFLSTDQIDDFFRKIDRQWQIDEFPFLITFRPKEQGGNRKLTEKERKDFWNSGYDGFWAGDFEEDVIDYSWSWLWENRICSFHNFIGVPEDFSQIYKRLKVTDADILKIAAQANDITDTIPIWKLLEKAKSENKQIIPIAMGEAGKWTRILGLAHGAFMTYAALDEKSATAPGQITAWEMIDVYRVKELNEQTEIYGIIGGSTTYSRSPYLQNAAFKYHNLNAVFVPLQVQNLDEFMRRMVKPETREIELNFKGFAVTIPHKTKIIKHLDKADETAKAIGAVNTVKIENGKLFGYNTDAQGFIKPLKNSFSDLNNAKIAVLGAGGAARACIYALKKDGAEVTIFARNIEKAKNLAEEFQIELRELPTNNEQRTTNFNYFDILVNATPLGTKGELENKTPVFADEIKNVSLCYDLVYNPLLTRFLREAQSVNIPTIGGLEMLVAQGAEQFKIWTGFEAPIEEMRKSAIRKLQS